MDFIPGFQFPSPIRAKRSARGCFCPLSPGSTFSASSAGPGHPNQATVGGILPQFRKPRAAPCRRRRAGRTPASRRPQASPPSLATRSQVRVPTARRGVPAQRLPPAAGARGGRPARVARPPLSYIVARPFPQSRLHTPAPHPPRRRPLLAARPARSRLRTTRLPFTLTGTCSGLSLGATVMSESESESCPSSMSPASCAIFPRRGAAGQENTSGAAAGRAGGAAAAPAPPRGESLRQRRPARGLSPHA